MADLIPSAPMSTSHSAVTPFSKTIWTEDSFSEYETSR